LLFWIYRVKTKDLGASDQACALSISRRSPASRRKTVRPQPTSPEAARDRELTTKRRGELAELAFTLKAASLGFGVSKPHGDSERYDCILDADDLHPSTEIRSRKKTQPTSQVCRPERSRPVSKANRPAKSKDPLQPALPQSHKGVSTPAPTPSRLWRLQVKCSTQMIDGLYRVNACRRVHGRAVPYLPSEIDFFAAYIIPEDSWFIIPIQAVGGRSSLLFRRKRDRKPGLYDQYREAWHLLQSV
jgi:hypothetical protein